MGKCDEPGHVHATPEVSVDPVWITAYAFAVMEAQHAGGKSPDDGIDCIVIGLQAGIILGRRAAAVSDAMYELMMKTSVTGTVRDGKVEKLVQAKDVRDSHLDCAVFSMIERANMLVAQAATRHQDAS